MRLVSVLTCLAGLLLWTTASLAGCPTYGGYYYTPTYYTPTYYYQPVIEKRVVVLDYYPAFPVGYATAYTAPPATEVRTTTTQTTSAPAPSACETKLTLLETKFNLLETQLKATLTTPATVVPRSAPEAERTEPSRPRKANVSKDEAIRAGVAVLQSHCAKCHTGAASKKDPDTGQAVTIFSEPGKPNEQADVVALMLAIEDGRMPPEDQPKLSAADKAAVRTLVKLAAKK